MLANHFYTQNDVERIFGGDVLQRIQRILAGSYDDLSLLPEKVSLKICSYLDLQSIAQLSQVNRHLREVCNSNQLWESLYYDHQVSKALQPTYLSSPFYRIEQTTQLMGCSPTFLKSCTYTCTYSMLEWEDLNMMFYIKRPDLWHVRDMTYTE